MVQRVAELADRSRRSLNEYDPLQEPFVLSGPTKKRRVDQDTREAVVARL